jgi:hypothetical protein
MVRIRSFQMDADFHDPAASSSRKGPETYPSRFLASAMYL